MTRIFRFAGLAAAVAVALLAIPGPRLAEATQPASLTGTWLVTIESPQGALETTWELEQADDGSLAGVTKSDLIGEASFEGGWVDGDTFGFSVYIDMQGQAFDVLYEGTFTDDEVAGVLDVGGGQFTADFTGVRIEGGAR